MSDYPALAPEPREEAIIQKNAEQGYTDDENSFWFRHQPISMDAIGRFRTIF